MLISYDNCVTVFDIHFGRPRIAFYRAVTFLSKFLMAGSEYGTA